jgi:Exonuclease
VSEALTASPVLDQGGDAEPGGEPLEFIGGVPLYRWGQAPEHLRTQTQLGGERLKVGAGQVPAGYLRTRKYGDVALYDRRFAMRMRPLPAAAKASMAARRTCPQCHRVRTEIVRGGSCPVCRLKAERARVRLLARTCAGCGTVRQRPYPGKHRRCQGCRQAQLAQQREQARVWLERVTTCGGEGCTVRVVTRKEARAWRRAQGASPSWGWAGHWPRRCPPCQAAHEVRVARAQREREEAAQAAVEARSQQVAALEQWARQVLADELTVVLDTETTGLGENARIVELSVITAAGEVLLDTLLDPGEPIPAEATGLHGIGDQDVAGAPTFSEILPQLTAVLQGRRVVIYNAPYDTGRLRHELTLHHLAVDARNGADAAVSAGVRPDREAVVDGARAQAEAWLDWLRIEDAMVPYSDWFGDWSEYWGNYRWQPLDGGHRALADCRAVVSRLAVMGAAGVEDSAAA